MQYYHTRQDGTQRLFAVTDGTAYDLTGAKPGLASFGALAEA